MISSRLNSTSGRESQGRIFDSRPPRGGGGEVRAEGSSHDPRRPAHGDDKFSPMTERKIRSVLSERAFIAGDAFLHGPVKRAIDGGGGRGETCSFPR